jgi:hypothetical protein
MKDRYLNDIFDFDDVISATADSRVDSEPIAESLAVSEPLMTIDQRLQGLSHNGGPKGFNGGPDIF